ncbi:hypothetical protein K440DRAFT_633388 [Wilcoxina mikolae CBS 423.85]|nr:hypothetical protein K440DRAFT_633388 [Wilcoxina mikolae CBS 423.85]
MQQISSHIIFFCLILVLLCLFHPAVANVEKEIFIAPAPPKLLENSIGSHLPELMPSEHCRNCRATRTRLGTSFVGKGKEHWVRIDGLEDGRRYEVRICWAATQPTDFTLDLFAPDKVLAEPSLLEQIQKYPSRTSSVRSEGSVLYLRVFAKTAYVSSSTSRMQNPEPVDVDIILDPYIFNLIPESLLKIIGVIVIVAVSSWWLGGWIHNVLLGFASLTKLQTGGKKDT